MRSNGYSGREEWLGDWRAARSGEFFVLGSRDETGGCQLCVAQVADDGSLTLRVRLPDCLAEKHGKYLVIQGVRFAYGEEQVLAALESNGEYAAHRREHGEKSARATELGQAISYRFKRDAKGWRVFVSTEMMEVPAVTDQRRGAMGVDLNADHLAVAETDPSGNYVNAWRVPLVTYGKSKHQAEALIGDAVAGVVEYAREVGKPIVIEKLDFRHKKAALEGESPRYRRMLSSFSYGKVKAYFISRGYREGVEVKQVNPAFSSVVGRVKFMERYGLSVHQAAALVLARRLLGCSERIPHRWVAPIGNGVHVAFTVPERKRVKHVWTYWGAVLGQLRPEPFLQRPYRWSELRKLVVLLAIAALVSSVTAVLAGCGSPAPTVEDGPQAARRLVAAPAETTPPLLKPTATESTPLVDGSASTPTPEASAGDGIEFAPVDYSGTSKKEEPIRVVEPDSPRKGGPGATGPVQGDAYTWQDGDRTMTVKLQTDLVVEKGSGGLPRDVVAANEGGTNVVRSADGLSKSDTLPVFRSESGALMTLPGGVLLVLSSEWGQAETNAFFSNNGIKMDRVSELDYVANGFFVETGPGFPSLDLANVLAAQDGVEISSPNWGREATPK